MKMYSRPPLVEESFAQTLSGISYIGINSFVLHFGAKMCNLKNLGDFSLLQGPCYLLHMSFAAFWRCTAPRFSKVFIDFSLVFIVFSVVFTVVSTVCIDFSHIIYDYQSFHVFSDGF